MYEKIQIYFYSFKSLIAKKALRNGGYSYIELMVVISVMAILFVVGFANYRDYENRQQVVGAARDLRADLRLAQEYALSGKLVNNCTGLVSYGVNRISIAGDYGYSLTGFFNSCPVGGSTQTLKVVLLTKKYNLTSGTPLTPNFNVTYYVLGRGVVLNPSGSSLTINVATTGYSEGVVVTTGGEIK